VILVETDPSAFRGSLSLPYRRREPSVDVNVLWRDTWRSWPAQVRFPEVEMVSVVERYLRAVVDHDWGALADCLADDVIRVGPFGDTYTPKGPYVAFLEELMPSLEGYSMDVERIVEAGPVVVAELTETVEIGGNVHVTPEALVFDIDPDGRIVKVDIFIKRLTDGN
jgi:hypothetical protein